MLARYLGHARSVTAGGVCMLVACSAALITAAPAFAGTLDVSQTNVGSGGHGLNVGAAATPAQTFTAGRSGGVDQVDVWIEGNIGCDLPLIVQIRSVDSEGVPTGELLATSSIARSGVPVFFAGPQPIAALFPTPPPVTAGTQYAIVLSRPDFEQCYRWADAAADVYSGGQSFTGANGAAFTPQTDPTDDQGFRTYVCDLPCTPLTAPVTPPGTAPETTITRGMKRSETGKAKFRFTSDEANSSFECKIKGPDLKRKLKQFRDCDSPRKYKNLDEGRFKFKVRAIDAAGNVDPTPDKDRFRVVD